MIPNKTAGFPKKRIVLFLFYPAALLCMVFALLAGMLYFPEPPAVLGPGTPVAENGERSVLSSSITLKEPEKCRFRFVHQNLQYLFPAVRERSEPEKIYLTGVVISQTCFPYSDESSRTPFLWITVFLLVLLAAGYSVYHNADDEARKKSRDFFLLFFLIGVHYLLLSLFRYQEPCVYVSEADSLGYFAVIRQILDGDWHTPGRYTAGLGLLYLPFIGATGARDVSGITPYLAMTSSLLTLPLAYAGCFFLLRKYLKNSWTAFAATGLWILSTGFFFMIERPVHGGTFSPFGIFHYQQGTDYIYQAYKLVLTGFSQLSECPGYLFSILAMSCAAFLRKPYLRAVFCGLCFGFACLIRLNNCFFAPVLFYIFLREDRDFFREKIHTVLICLIASGAFFAMFSFQLILNHCYFGDFLCFPYSLHYKELYEGFRFANLPRSAEYYFSCFAPLAGLFTAGLLTTEDRGERLFTELAAIPMFLFFCGLCELGQNYRFLMPVYVFLTAGCVNSRVWKEGPVRDRILLGSLLLLLIIPEWPVRFFLCHPAEVMGFMDWVLLFRSWYFLPLAFSAAGWFLYRKDHRKLFFLGIYLLFLLLPGQVWYAGIFAGMLLTDAAAAVCIPFYEKYLQKKR